MGREVVYRGISFSDFLSAGIILKAATVDGKLIVASGTQNGKPLDLKKLPDMLFVLGIVKDHNVEVQPKSQHRRLDGKIVEDYRIVGKERNDKAWINSGFASDEAIMSSSKMHDMSSQAWKLQNGGG